MPSTRRQKATFGEQEEKNAGELDHFETDADDTPVKRQWQLDGVVYETYTDFVAAKRARNQQQLRNIGLIKAVDDLRDAAATKKASQRGIARKRKGEPAVPLTRRKSNRLAGVHADGRFVDHESSGKFVIGGRATAANTPNDNGEERESAAPDHFNDRVNDGSGLSITQAVELSGPKWIDEGSSGRAEKFVNEDLIVTKNRAVKSPTSVAHCVDFDSKVGQLSIDDPGLVAKVTPERIYSVACHPSTESLIVCAGDKLGHVGMWNVDDRSDDHDGVHLFRVHTRPVTCLAWTPTGSSLLSSSYDGSVRWLDTESQTFSQIFATFDDSVTYRNELGRGFDGGYKDWVQYVTPDHRNASEQCFFMSTSMGMATHVDLRAGKGKVTFHEQLSEKKINTLSLHCNGNTLASAGLDCAVRLWDIRKFGDSRLGKHQPPKAFASQQATKSINSAFFSPSGSRLLSTTMADSLDLTNNPHLAKNTFKPTRRIRHDNRTGRWLSTFMAQWHPQQDMFVSGSMQRPRAIDVFDGDGIRLRAIQGEALTAVASRCCFHPSSERLVIVGGNSSGRLSVCR